jgi:hypothetical protein
MVENDADVFLSVIYFPHLAEQNVKLIVLVGKKLITHSPTRRNNPEFLFLDVVSFQSRHFIFFSCIMGHAHDRWIIFNA